MTDWAFRTWPRILAGSTLLSAAFGVLHIAARAVLGLGARPDLSTAALVALVFAGYLGVAWHLRRNPYGGAE